MRDIEAIRKTVEDCKRQMALPGRNLNWAEVRKDWLYDTLDVVEELCDEIERLRSIMENKQ